MGYMGRELWDVIGVLGSLFRGLLAVKQGVLELKLGEISLVRREANWGVFLTIWLKLSCGDNKGNQCIYYGQCCAYNCSLFIVAFY